MKRSNNIILLIIAVATLILIAIGATFAYYVVTTTNSFGTRYIYGNVPSLGSVSLLKHKTDLSINMSIANMLDTGADVIYYADNNTGSKSPISQKIGTATVIGDGVFTCTYTLAINKTGNNDLYIAFQNMPTSSTNQIVLTINNGGVDTVMDFKTANLFPKTINATIRNLSKNNPVDITAQLKIVNKTGIDQSPLAGKDITISFEIQNLECTIVG